MYITFETQVEKNRKTGVVSVRKDACLPIVTLENGEEYYVAEDFDHASKAAVSFWKKIISDAPDQLDQLIGESVLKNWEQGKEDGPGDEKINTSLNEWVENTVEKHPDMAFAHFEGAEHPVQLSNDLIDHLQFVRNKKMQVAFPVPDSNMKGTIPPP